jgi:hypothetical protein
MEFGLAMCLATPTHCTAYSGTAAASVCNLVAGQLAGALSSNATVYVAHAVLSESLIMLEGPTACSFCHQLLSMWPPLLQT